MAYVKPTFSVHDYDSDGDINEAGVFLHLKDTRVKIADTPEGFRHFTDYLQSMQEEVEDRWDE